MEAVLRISSDLVLEARSTTRLSVDALSKGSLKVLQVSLNLFQGANLTLHTVNFHESTFKSIRKY